jgi:acylphosphatase
MPLERRRVLYRGRVQGVGFRYTTRRIAEGFDVAGYVRNLEDGRVEVVAEGEADQVSTFLAAVAEAIGAHIRGVDEAVETPGAEDLDGFSIRF